MLIPSAWVTRFRLSQAFRFKSTWRTWNNRGMCPFRNKRKDCRCFQTSHVLGLGNRNFDYRFWNWNMDVWVTLRMPKYTILLLGSLSVEQANNKWFLNVTVSVRASNLREKHFGIGSMKLWICWLGSGNIETQHFVSRSVSKLVVSLKTDLSTASQLVISTRSDS